MSSNVNTVAQIIIEFLEIAVHSVLKVREIYPDTIFVKKQKYGAIVHQAIHPQLKEYISNCMKAAYEIAKENQLEKLVICFLKSQEIHEKIVFDITGLRYAMDRDPFLLDIEKSFKSFFCQLHSMNEYLYPASDDVTFALQIHTTESTGISYMENPAYQNFPWMQINPSYSEILGSEIIPLEMVDNNYENIQVYIEKKLIYS